MVDASDFQKFPLVRSELMKIGSDRSLDSMPVLILGNKVDVPGSITEEGVLEEELRMGRYLRNGRRMWTLRMCWSGDVEALANALLWGIEERALTKGGGQKKFSKRRD